VRQKIGQIEKRNIRRILDHPGGFEEYVGTLFLKAVTLCHDPHTNYLSKTDWQNYEGALSRESLSFGVDLDETDEGAVTIARLVPGGPAWKSNELHKGDVLLALRWGGKNPVDLAGADLEEVEGLLQSSNADRLEITVQKTNGMVKTVALLKEKIREEENVVKSFILKGDKKIGYISLPGFYTEWESRTGQGCANDVAKEIVKLQKEKVEGLILDIRYNGGGSLGEGVDLAGIFIDQGPMCVMKGPHRKARNPQRHEPGHRVRRAAGAAGERPKCLGLRSAGGRLAGLQPRRRSWAAPLSAKPPARSCAPRLHHQPHRPRGAQSPVALRLRDGYHRKAVPGHRPECPTEGRAARHSPARRVRRAGLPRGYLPLRTVVGLAQPQILLFAA
jgi:C-terminal peptidase prc